MSDELGSHLERPIHFECKLNEPIYLGMRLLHTVAPDHSVSISRQQVHHIFRFSLRSRTGIRPLSGVVQQPWRRDVTSLFPPSGNEGYICNRDVPYQSVTLDIHRMTDELGSLPKGHGCCPLQFPMEASDEQAGRCNRRTGSSCLPRQDVLDRLSLLLCSWELLGHVHVPQCF